MRLFSALWPAPSAVEHLQREFRAVGLTRGVRATPAERWHVTLAFYGNDASAPERASHLDEHVTGLSAPELRLAGAGVFPGVLWVGVEPVSAADREALRILAAAAGAGRRFTPHVTVARFRLDQPARLMADQLARYRGPSWTATAADLVRSDAAAGYTTVHSVPLGAWPERAW